MTNWLLRILLSLSLAFFFLHGQSHQPVVARQNGICLSQSAEHKESAVTAKIQARTEQALTGVVVSSHKKDKSIQKLLITDNGDDDDSDEFSSFKKQITASCFFLHYLLSASPSDLTKQRLPQSHHLSVLLSGRHLLLCTLRI